MASKKLWQNTKFLKKINDFLLENRKEVIDIILFGSVIKGKNMPNDVDLLILFNDKKNLELGYELRKKLEKDLAVSVISKTYKEFFEGSFKARDSILAEGFSLTQKKFLAEGFGYNGFILFKYELKKFNKSERMRFYYSLLGRGEGKGLLKETKAIKFSDMILLCPIESENKMSEYLNIWKINYEKFPILIPERIINLLKK